MSGFEIHVPNTNVQDGSAPISWCVTPGFVEELSAANVADPYVFIIVTPLEGHAEVKERRYAVPMGSMMAYVEFSGYGKNRVYAFVAAQSERRKFFEPLSYSRWMRRYVYQSYDDDVLRLIPDCAGRTWIDVMVPENAFAKEPPEWLAAWVNWRYDLPPIDSCEFQRRLYGFAAHIQFVMFAVLMAIRVVIYTVMKLSLIENVSAQPILHPLRHDLADLEDKANGEFVFLPSKWLKVNWAIWYLPSLPSIMLLLTIFLWPLTGIALALSFSAEWALGWAVLVTSIALVVKAWRLLGRKIRPRSNSEDMLRSARLQAKKAERLAHRDATRNRAIEEEAQRLYWYKSAEAVAPLICTPDKPKAPLTSVADLPSERRTVWLRIAEYKASSCRPYAK